MHRMVEARKKVMWTVRMTLAKGEDKELVHGIMVAEMVEEIVEVVGEDMMRSVMMEARKILMRDKDEVFVDGVIVKEVIAE